MYAFHDNDCLAASAMASHGAPPPHIVSLAGIINSRSIYGSGAHIGGTRRHTPNMLEIVRMLVMLQET